MTQLLLEMDALTPSTQVTVIAATNRPDLLDRALLRPGRFDRLLFVPPPDLAAREKIFALCLRGTPLEADVDACQLSCQLAARSEGYTGADITAICREAKLAALEEDLTAACVGMRHFDKALGTVKKSVSPLESAFYANFQRG
ncbi:hypothetical protein CLOM_g13943 [Closterium sp. NIES-68]|nr:hypothetical protein CLOM_g13943 [Closterium sp. NIES-68]